MHRLAPAEPTALHGRLSEFLGQSVDGLPVVSDTHPQYQHANVQLAIDAYLAGPDRAGEPVASSAVRTGPRVGVSGPGGVPPWRFWADGEPTVSVYRPAMPRRRASRA
jgi:hypothetical protein